MLYSVTFTSYHLIIMNLMILLLFQMINTNSSCLPDCVSLWCLCLSFCLLLDIYQFLPFFLKDPIAGIMKSLGGDEEEGTAKSKRVVMAKIMELQLVEKRQDLLKKPRGGRKRRKGGSEEDSDEGEPLFPSSRRGMEVEEKMNRNIVGQYKWSLSILRLVW